VKISKLTESMIRLFGRNVEMQYTQPRPSDKLSEELSEPEEVLEKTDQRKISWVISSKEVNVEKLEGSILRISQVRCEKNVNNLLDDILQSEWVLVQK